MESVADTIVANAIKIGLSVCADSPTPGVGNCFYHSVLQQLARLEIVPVIKTPELTHTQLRGQCVSMYMNIRNR